MKRVERKILPMMTDPARIRRTDPGDPENVLYGNIIKHLQNYKMKRMVIMDVQLLQLVALIVKIAYQKYERRNAANWNNLAKISKDDAKILP